MSAHEAGLEPQPPRGTSFPLHLIRDTPLIRGTRSPDGAEAKSGNRDDGCHRRSKKSSRHTLDVCRDEWGCLVMSGPNQDITRSCRPTQTSKFQNRTLHSFFAWPADQTRRTMQTSTLAYRDATFYPFAILYYEKQIARSSDSGTLFVERKIRRGLASCCGKPMPYWRIRSYSC